MNKVIDFVNKYADALIFLCIGIFSLTIDLIFNLREFIFMGGLFIGIAVYLSQEIMDNEVS